MLLHPGDTIDGGKYRIVRLLGEGGMGAVYEGEDLHVQRRVAIKVLHAAVAAKADAVQRFEREAQAAGRIGSEHIVEVLDTGDVPGSGRYMVMELLEGESLGARVRRRGRLEPRELVGVLYQLLEGLRAAHDAGIVHRDLEPNNVFLADGIAGRRDFVKILGFGASKLAPGQEGDFVATRTGAMRGTPFYMSPEQARGQEVDARSDLYAVGVVAYQAVTGSVPFQAATFNELVFKIALEAPEPPEVAAPGLDPAFAALILRAMERDPAKRYQSARELEAALARWAAAAGAPLDRPSGIFPIPVGGSGAHDAMVLATTVDPEELVDTLRQGAAPASGRDRLRSAVIGASALVALVVGAVGAHRVLGAIVKAPPSAAAAAAPAPPAVTATVAPTAESTAEAPAAEAPSATAEASASKPPPRAASSAAAAPRATVTGHRPGLRADEPPYAPDPIGRRIGSDL